MNNKEIEEKGKKYIVNPINEYIIGISMLKEINEDVVCMYKGQDETGYRFNEEDINIKICIEGCKNLYIGVAFEPNANESNDRVGIYWGIVSVYETCKKEPYEELVSRLNSLFKEGIIVEKDCSNWIWTQRLISIAPRKWSKTFMNNFWVELNDDSFAQELIKRIQKMLSDTEVCSFLTSNVF